MAGAWRWTDILGYVVDLGWEWDPSLYAGSAAYYPRGRMAYPQELIDALVAELGLDGSGRFLDVGCGPGSLTLLLAGWFQQATGLDADAEMLAEAARQARAAGTTNVEWVHLRAEDIPADLGPFRAVTLAQSFHWMDRPRVARLLRGVLDPDGVAIHVHAATHEGVESEVPLRYPRPPRRGIAQLIEQFLGSRRRAGQGTLPETSTTETDTGRLEAAIYRAAGFTNPTRIEIPGRVITRSVEDIVASVFSLSSAAPHLFGDQVHDFEAALRELLTQASADARFDEQMCDTAVDIWRA